MRTLSKFLILIISIALLAGCLYEVRDGSGKRYEVQADGSIDMRSASHDDVLGLSMRGFYTAPDGTLAITQCKAPVFAADYTPFLADDNGTSNRFYTIDQRQDPDVAGSLLTFCGFEEYGDDFKLKLAVQLDGRYVPVLSTENTACIANLGIAGVNVAQALADCLGADSRSTTNLLGLNQYVEEINVLTVIVSADFVASLSS